MGDGIRQTGNQEIEAEMPPVPRFPDRLREEPRVGNYGLRVGGHLRGVGASGGQAYCPSVGKDSTWTNRRVERSRSAAGGERPGSVRGRK